MTFKTKKNSNKQEKRIAKELGGRRIPGSGSRWDSKGDVKTKKFLVEAKTTTHKSFSVSSDILAKVELEAVGTGRTPVVSVELTGGSVPKRYAVLSWEDFLALTGEDDQ